MEDLIWKYLDGECTQEEKEKVTHLMEEDTKFKELFSRLTHLHQSLATHSMITMSDSLKTKLVNQIEEQLKSQEVTDHPILSKTLIICLVLIGISAIAIPLLIPSESNILQHWQVPINQTTMQYAIWSMIGFLTLLLVDQIISKPTKMRNQMYSLM